MWKLKTLSLAVILLILGCAQPIALKTPFNPDEHEFALRPGKATVTAQAFMRRNDGIVVYAAGSEAMLWPATSYTKEIYDISQRTYITGCTNLDQRFMKYVRVTQADGEGKFSFRDIPDGEYLLLTQVHWKAGNSSQGGDLTRYITVSKGVSVEAILTQ